MVEWILRHYRSKNRNVAVLSRGYGRKTKGFLEVTLDHKPSEVGDEPLQLKHKFPETTIVVDQQRVRGMHLLEQNQKPELVILDDGFQHRKIKAHKYILLTALDDLYTDQTYLPSGDLRDHRSQACRADLIIVTKCPKLPDGTTQKSIVAKIKPLPHQKVLFATLEYEAPVSVSGKVRIWEQWTQQPFTLVTGIAKPVALVNFLKYKGLTFEHLNFSDHHVFTKAELDRINKSGCILTTEKDAVRLKGLIAEFFVVGVRHGFDSEQQSFFSAFLDAI
jgi:tetraacyldisaccharide 4'-kinase